MPDIDDARRILKDTFGLTRFRTGQKRIIRRLLDGRSALAILPTAGGKSLCYQFPALLLDGLTVVVSPLIALMKDQVDSLVARGVPAARLDSSLGAVHHRQVYADLRAGRLQLLYLAPERLASDRLRHALAGRENALLAIDEAHCISEWGHNFRPEYLRLAQVAEQLGVGRVLALTATATPQVARDIAGAFGIADADIIQASFHRPNLELHATPCHADERRKLLLKRLRGRPAGPTIIYVTLHKTAEELAEFLARKGFDAAAYHAGIENERRHTIQDAFMESEDMVVVATTAFGMGIDKADIRYIYHFNLPKSLESYAQEIGRAGRDGLAAVCELFASAGDVVTLENFAYGDTPTAPAIEALMGDVLDRGPAFDVSIAELSNTYDIRQAAVKTLLTYLELDGVLRATGVSFAEYRFQLERPVAAILKGFPADRANLARRLIDMARQGSIWRTLDVDAAVATLKVPREWIASVLTDMELHADITLKASGVREGYRRLRPDVERDRLCRDMIARFLEREESAVARVHDVLECSHVEGCLTRALLSHFGEAMEEDCGHCSRCQRLGRRPVPIVPARTLADCDRVMVAGLRSEGRPPLRSPRQRARFLCGLSSPATVQDRLTRDPRFGSLADVPFLRVLRLVEREAMRAAVSSELRQRSTRRPSGEVCRGEQDGRSASGTRAQETES